MQGFLEDARMECFYFGANIGSVVTNNKIFI